MKLAKVTGGFFKDGNNFFRIKERYVMSSSLTGITGPQSAAIDREGGRIFVGTGGVNQVKVLDYVTLSVLSTMSIGNSAYGCTVDKNGGRVFVCSPSGGVIRVFDYTTLALQSTLTGFNTGGAPYWASMDASRIFVTNGNSISILDYTTPSTTLSTIPGFTAIRAMVVDQPGGRVFVCDQLANSISVRSYSTPSTLLTSISINSPFGIDIDYRNNVIFVTNVSANTVSVLDYTTLSLVNTISATAANLSSPRMLSVDKYSNRLFIPVPANSISII